MRLFSLSGREIKEVNQIREVELFARKYKRDGGLSKTDIDRLISLGPAYTDTFKLLVNPVDSRKKWRKWVVECNRHRRFWESGKLIRSCEKDEEGIFREVPYSETFVRLVGSEYNGDTLIIEGDGHRSWG